MKSWPRTCADYGFVNYGDPNAFPKLKFWLLMVESTNAPVQNLQKALLYDLLHAYIA